MKNLDQIRAQNALKAAGDSSFKGENKGEVVKKVPAMIQQNGLLGTLAFAISKTQGQEKGYEEVLKASIEHYFKLPNVVKPKATDLEGFSKWLCEQDAAQLRAVTTEFLAYLNYLRRYVDKNKK